MIERSEIDDKANEFGISTTNVQRDYVFGWLLFAIYSNDYLAKLLILKGGNCFRKAYFPNTRFSSDLDFSTQEALNLERFEQEIERACKHAADYSGIQFVIERNSFTEAPRANLGEVGERRIYKGKVFFVDFYGTRSTLEISVRVDVTEFDRFYLPISEMPIIHPYSDSDRCQVNLRCMAIEEAIASKMKCLLQRRHSFDLYDLVYAAFFNTEITLNRTDIMNVFLRKTIFDRSPGSAKQILLGLPMAFFRAAWEKYIVCPAQSMLGFDQAEEVYSRFITNLFQGYGSSSTSSAFFPAELRNRILEAGSGKKLIKVSYHGFERMMEPYALVYKRRVSDNVAQEYLYVWDRHGGNSGKVGVKSLLNPDIRSLEVLDETFEPRFEIELSKAGEPLGKGYFGNSSAVTRSNIENRRKRTRVNPYLGGQKRTIQCPHCQKKFTRNSSSTTLNPHKNNYGQQCSGRTGYFVGWSA